jgi:hypothetical protein
MWLEIGVARSPVNNDAVLTESAQRQWSHVAGPRDRAEHLVQRQMRPRLIVQLVFGAPIGPRSEKSSPRGIPGPGAWPWSMRSWRTVTHYNDARVQVTRRAPRIE